MLFIKLLAAIISKRPAEEVRQYLDEYLAELRMKTVQSVERHDTLKKFTPILKKYGYHELVKEYKAPYLEREYSLALTKRTNTPNTLSLSALYKSCVDLDDPDSLEMYIKFAKDCIDTGYLSDKPSECCQLIECIIKSKKPELLDLFLTEIKQRHLPLQMRTGCYPLNQEQLHLLLHHGFINRDTFHTNFTCFNYPNGLYMEERLTIQALEYLYPENLDWGVRPYFLTLHTAIRSNNMALVGYLLDKFGPYRTHINPEDRGLILNSIDSIKKLALISKHFDIDPHQVTLNLYQKCLDNIKHQAKSNRESETTPGRAEDLEKNRRHLNLMDFVNACAEANLLSHLYEIKDPLLRGIILIYGADKIQQREFHELLHQFMAETPEAAFNYLIYCIQNAEITQIQYFISQFHQQIENNQQIFNAIIQTYNPAIVRLFYDDGFDFDKNYLVAITRIASLEKDHDSLEYFLKALGDELDKNELITFTHESPTSKNSGESSDSTSSTESDSLLTQQYGKGHGTFKQRMQKLITLMLYGLIYDKFDFAFTPFSTEPDTHDRISLTTLGFLRQFIAISSMTEYPFDFGRERDYSLYTSCKNDRYRPYYDQLKEKLLAMYYNAESDEHFKNVDYILTDDGELNITGFISTTINDEVIELTNYKQNGFRSSPDYGWQHTDHKKLPSLLSAIGNMIRDIVNLKMHSPDPEENAQHLIAEIAKVHWYLAHACPYRRGSAAITESIIQALFQYHGYIAELSNMPDCIALSTTTPDEYSQHYSVTTNLKLTPIVWSTRPSSLASTELSSPRMSI